MYLSTMVLQDFFLSSLSSLAALALIRSNPPSFFSTAAPRLFRDGGAPLDGAGFKRYRPGQPARDLLLVGPNKIKL